MAIALGGSILAPSEPDATFLQQVAATLLRIAAHRPLLVAVGGGAPARRAIGVARTCGVGEEALDRVGIAATRLNAQVLLSLLATRMDLQAEPPRTIEEAVALLETQPLVIMGGTTPGHSTDFVAAQLAVASGAERVVIATNVDGVYERDPRADPDAKRLERLDFDALLKIVGQRSWTQAGAPGVVDGPASLLVAQEGLETCVVRGSDLENLEAVCSGRPFEGTCVAGAKVAL